MTICTSLVMDFSALPQVRWCLAKILIQSYSLILHISNFWVVCFTCIISIQNFCILFYYCMLFCTFSLYERTCIWGWSLFYLTPFEPTCANISNVKVIVLDCTVLTATVICCKVCVGGSEEHLSFVHVDVIDGSSSSSSISSSSSSSSSGAWGGIVVKALCY
jgi:hypothetical protein